MNKELPEMCYGVLNTTGEIIVLKRFEKGYYDQRGRHQGSDADKLNEGIGVNKGQRKAMEAGSMFGWEVPASKVYNYDEDGNWLGRRSERDC